MVVVVVAVAVAVVVVDCYRLMYNSRARTINQDIIPVHLPTCERPKQDIATFIDC